MSEVLLTHTPGEDEARASLDELTRPVVAFVDAVNRGDLEAAVDELAPDALHYGRVSNYRPEGVRVLFGMLRTVFPDLRLDIRDLAVDGNRVTTRIVATGTHTGSFLGKPATGQPVAWQSVDVAEVGELDGADGSYWKILRRFWDLWGDPSLWRDIGFVPAIMC
jgi:predicted ester cyclase